MSQKFPDITQNSYIDTGILDLQDRDDSTLTLFSGVNEPSNPFLDAFWNDLTNNCLKYYYNDSWQTLIDYEKVYISKSNVGIKYQPLNQNLTQYSSTTVNEMGFIAYNTFVPMSSFFISKLSVDFVDSIELGKLAYKNSLTSLDIENSSIPEEKLSGEVQTTPVFNIGDIIPSFSPGNKSGCIKLSKSSANIFTIGATASSSTYKGDKYKNLYEFLWTNYEDLQIYNSGGVITTRGESWSKDWSSNKRLALPSIKSPNEDKPKDILVESSQSGIIRIGKSGYYELTLVGGGGGGGAVGAGSGGHQESCSGASGGAVKDGIILLEDGDIISYEVGKGGLKGRICSDTGYPGSKGDSGGDSVVRLNGDNLISASGGEGGQAWWRHSFIAGNGGEGSLEQENVFYSGPNLINGESSASTNSNAIMSVSGPLGNNYGRGGDAQATSSYGSMPKDGFDGYFSLVYLSPKEYKTPDSGVVSTLDILYGGMNYFMKF